MGVGITNRISRVLRLHVSNKPQPDRLVDTKQSLVYAQDSEWIKDIIGSSWYSVSNPKAIAIR